MPATGSLSLCLTRSSRYSSCNSLSDCQTYLDVDENSRTSLPAPLRSLIRKRKPSLKLSPGHSPTSPPRRTIRKSGGRDVKSIKPTSIFFMPMTASKSLVISIRSVAQFPTSSCLRSTRCILPSRAFHLTTSGNCLLSRRLGRPMILLLFHDVRAAAVGCLQENCEHHREHVQARGVEFGNAINDDDTDRVRSNGRPVPVAMLKRDVNRRPQETDSTRPAGTPMTGPEQATMWRRGGKRRVGVGDDFCYTQHNAAP